MNRRDLLKRVAAVPVAAAVAPLVIANDGVALNSVAHPEVMPLPFSPPSPQLFATLDEFESIARRRLLALQASIRQNVREFMEGPEPAYILNEATLETVEIELPDHDWSGSDVCAGCGTTQEAVENGDQPMWCQRSLTRPKLGSLLSKP